MFHHWKCRRLFSWGHVRARTLKRSFIYQFALSSSSLWGFHNYHVYHVIQPYRWMNWIVRLWRENSHDGIACACVTSQSHSWKLCSDKCFRFGKCQAPNWKNKTDCDIAVNNTNSHIKIMENIHTFWNWVQRRTKEKGNAIVSFRVIEYSRFKRLHPAKKKQKAHF